MVCFAGYLLCAWRRDCEIRTVVDALDGGPLLLTSSTYLCDVVETEKMGLVRFVLVGEHPAYYYFCLWMLNSWLEWHRL